MQANSGKAQAAPFRFFFVFATSLVLGAQAALAQSPAKSGPMQSGVHTRPTAERDERPYAENAPQALDVAQLFATSCGWCHSSGGRAAGKGPRLMGTELTDEQIVSRIRSGKTGQMPAFGDAFNEHQMRAIVEYIRNLKPETAGQRK
jgi:mono/diheme cytochrome c family protein